MTLSVIIGASSLLASLVMILWIGRMVARLENGRFLHFTRFFVIQGVAYASAAAGLVFEVPHLLTLARFLTPISYAYLVWGMTRRDNR